MVPYLQYKKLDLSVSSKDQQTQKNLLYYQYYFLREWKEKIDLADGDEEDVMFYNPKDTFYKANWPGCLDGSQMLTIPHPLILVNILTLKYKSLYVLSQGMVNTVARTKPGMLTLVSKAINSIYKTPDSIFVTAKAMDILFDGVVINCGVKDFAGKAVCTQLKESPDLRHVTDDDLAFSFMAPVIIPSCTKQ